MATFDGGNSLMRTMSSKEAENAFGLLVDQVRAEPVIVNKDGHAVVGVFKVEEYERLNNSDFAKAHKVRAA